MNQPLVSVTSAFYNTGPMLLDMVRSILCQTFTDWELILLDDGSTDDSLQIAQSIKDTRVRVYSNENNLGIPASLNKLTNLSRGKYIVRMDSDDINGKFRIQRQVEFMESHPEIDVVGCGMVYLDENDIPLGHRLANTSHAEICKSPTRCYGMAHPTIFAKKSWFEENRYNEAIPRASDYELFLRTHKTSRYANIREPLFYYRLGSSYNLKKQLIYRPCLIRIVSVHCVKYHHYGSIIFCLANQCARFVAEVACCAIGAKNKLLKRRYQQITEDQKQLYLKEIHQIKNTNLPVHS